MILFVDSTVREDSRTRRLAERLVSRLADDEVRVLHLEDEHLRPFDARTLARRTRAIEAGRWDSPLLAKAAEFASADQIVVAAPFWDLSFPALLKTYIEWISVIGGHTVIVFTFLFLWPMAAFGTGVQVGAIDGMTFSAFTRGALRWFLSTV